MTLICFGPFRACGRFVVLGVEGPLQNVDAGRRGASHPEVCIFTCPRFHFARR
jgi:hypothetical protein